MSEAAMLEREVSTQEYGHSDDTLFRLGRIAVEGAPELPTEDQLTTLARDDYRTGVDEMLKTDQEFRGVLDVESVHQYAVIDGQTRTADGTPIVEMIDHGVQLALAMAETDPSMAVQAIRDQGDHYNARKVDGLESGMTRFALSMDPKRQLEQEPARWNKLGYRSGIAYLQRYSKIDDQILDAGAYSIDLSDEETWKELFTEMGIPFDPNVDPNTWIKNGFELEMNAEESHQFALRIRERYYQKRQATHIRYSVNEYTQKHHQLLEQTFNTYYLPLSKAIYSGRNNSTLQELAGELLKRSHEMKATVRKGLIQIANSAKFDDAAGRLMDSMIRYATVEELRKGLKGLVVGRADLFNIHIPQIDPNFINQMMAANVQAGTQAGRSYGGCASEISLKSDSNKAEIEKNPQDIFGGNNPFENQSSSEACYYTHQSCYCCGYEDDGRPRTSKMTVVAYKDRKGDAYCQRKGCGAWITKDGVGDIGRIAKRAQQLKQRGSLALVHSISGAEEVE